MDVIEHNDLRVSQIAKEADMNSKALTDGPPPTADAATINAETLVDQPPPRSAILSALYAETTPAPVPEPWSFLGRGISIRELASARADVAARLLKQFSLRQLLDAGVFKKTGSDDPTLSPVLCSAPSKLLFSGAKTAINEVYSENGALSYTEPPAIHDLRLPADTGTQRPKGILLAGSDDDVQVLYRLDFKSRWIVGLEGLLGGDVCALRDSFNSVNPDHRMTIVAWQVALFKKEPPAIVSKVLEKLWQVRRCFNFELSGSLRVWVPTAADVNLAKTAATFGFAPLMRDLFIRSRSADTYELGEARNRLAQPARPDYAAAMAALVRNIEISRTIPKRAAVQDSVSHLGTVFNEVVLRPLYKKAQAAADPSERFLYLNQAWLANECFQRQPVLDTARQILNMDPVQEIKLSCEEIKTTLALTNEFLKVRKSLNQ
jgi:hypothetical protein